MNITFLRYAVEVEKTGSISLAARNLYLGQPNVSKAIKELETELGISIFKRTPKGVAPTPQGEMFLQQARAILSQMDELERMFRPQADACAALRVAVPRAGGCAEAFAHLTAGLNAQRALDMALCVAGTLEIIEKAAQQACHLGVICYDASQEQSYQALLAVKKLAYRPLREEPPLLLLGKDHPLAGRPIRRAQLEPYTELAFDDPGIPRPEAEQPSARRVVLSGAASPYELLRSVPGAYCWSAPMRAGKLAREGCVQRRCEDAPVRRIGVIYRKEYRLREIDQQFIAELNRIWAELAAENGLS